MAVSRIVGRAVVPGALVLVAASGAVAAQTDTSRSTRADSVRPRSLTAVTVTGRADDLIGVASTASQGHVGAAEIRARPLTREAEVLETVPGLIVTQHSGDGKAN